MTKEDKVFFTGLIKGLERRLDGHDKRFDGHDKRFDEHDKRFDEHDKRFAQIDKRFDKLEEKVEENSKGIRYNGMLIELMRDDIAQIREHDSFNYELNAKVDAVMEILGVELPVLKRTVASHSEKIRALEAKLG